jgi:hypothetical protein
MPIINPQDASDVDQYIQQIFSAPDSERPFAIRKLLVEKLDFNPATGIVSLANPPKNVSLPQNAERIASMPGLNVVYVPLCTPKTNRVRKAEAAAAAKLISDQLMGDILLVMTNNTSSQLHFIYPIFTGTTPSLRRMVIERDLPRRTAIQQLSNIYWQWKASGNIAHAVDRAFDVEAVTTEFFQEYKRVFDSVMGMVQGFGKGESEEEAKKLFVQTMFNRLMFIHFLSRKGWLKFKGELDYLNALWRDYPARSEEKNFYESRLKLLFFAGLNNKRSADLGVNNPALHALIGDPPFLNGGLFDQWEIEKRTGVVVPDGAIDLILHQLFDKFNFTVMESTPFDVEVAADPEMLGKVFEELVTGRHESDSYYTPRPVVSFMCREALKGYLESQNTGASPEAIRDFVDQKNTGKLPVVSAPRVGEALAKVTAVDPACGSGAYMLGMMQELVELMTALYSDQLSHNAQDLYNLKLQIIENNLYGADIDPFAVNIAMLRLWLSLALEYEGPVPQPLPNLNFKIVCGDSLLGPDPSPENYGDLFRHRVHQLAGQLAQLKQKHLRETGPAKANLADKIKDIQDKLREALADSATPEGVVDWRVEFAEVFDQRGGFDICIANPPYVVISSAVLRNMYRDGIYGRMNTYGLFIQRGLQITRNGSQLVYINPRTLLTDKYITNLRKLLLAQT